VTFGKMTRVGKEKESKDNRVKHRKIKKSHYSFSRTIPPSFRRTLKKGSPGSRQQGKDSLAGRKVAQRGKFKPRKRKLGTQKSVVHQWKKLSVGGPKEKE